MPRSQDMVGEKARPEGGKPRVVRQPIRPETRPPVICCKTCKGRLCIGRCRF